MRERQRQLDKLTGVLNFRNLEKDLGPLLDAMAQPLFQVVGGVGMILNGVLSLLGNIVRYTKPFYLVDVGSALTLHDSSTA